MMVCDWQINPEKISSNATTMCFVAGITKLLSFKKSEARLACISRHKNQVGHESLKNKNELISPEQVDERWRKQGSSVLILEDLRCKRFYN